MNKAAVIPAPIITTEFDLHRALAGDPMITRDGQPANLETFKHGASYPLRCAVGGKSHCFTARGTYWVNKIDPLDLFMSTEARP